MGKKHKTFTNDTVYMKDSKGQQKKLLKLIIITRFQDTRLIYKNQGLSYIPAINN